MFQVLTGCVQVLFCEIGACLSLNTEVTECTESVWGLWLRVVETLEVVLLGVVLRSFSVVSSRTVNSVALPLGCVQIWLT